MIIIIIILIIIQSLCCYLLMTGSPVQCQCENDTVCSFTLLICAAVNKCVLSLRLNSAVSEMVLSSVGKQFHARGPSTEKARSPSLRLDDCTMRSLLLAERSDARSC